MTELWANTVLGPKSIKKFGKFGTVIPLNATGKSSNCCLRLTPFFPIISKPQILSSILKPVARIAKSTLISWPVLLLIPVSVNSSIPLVKELIRTGPLYSNILKCLLWQGVVHKLCRLRRGEGGSSKDNLLHRPYLINGAHLVWFLGLGNLYKLSATESTQLKLLQNKKGQNNFPGAQFSVPFSQLPAVKKDTKI